MEMAERKRELRKIFLKKLIKQITEGKFNSTKPLPNDIYTAKSREYQSPLERDNYNYGYVNYPLF